MCRNGEMTRKSGCGVMNLNGKNSESRQWEINIGGDRLE